MSYEIMADGRYMWTSQFNVDGKNIESWYHSFDADHFRWMAENEAMLMAPVQELIDRLSLTDYQVYHVKATELGVTFSQKIRLIAQLSDSQKLILRMTK